MSIYTAPRRLDYRTQEAILSERVFISHYSKQRPQLVPTTLNESTYTCWFTNDKEEWRLGYVDMENVSMLQGMYELHFHLCMECVSIYAHTKNVCTYNFECKQMACFWRCVISSATELLSKLYMYSRHHWRTLRTKTPQHKYNLLLHNCILSHSQL